MAPRFTKRPTDEPILLRLSAREQLAAGRVPRRVTQLLVGLIGYGATVMVLVESGLGPASWNVLSEGLSETLNISFGWASNLIAVTVLVAWIPLRELPGIGTVLNVFVIGFAADLTAGVLPHPHDLPVQVLYLVGGLVGLAFFDALYLGAQFGSGPRDGIMTGLVRATGQPLALVRTVLEVVVAAAGWLLGGTPGAGTVLITVCIGPLVAVFLPCVAVRLRSPTRQQPPHVSD